MYDCLSLKDGDYLLPDYDYYVANDTLNTTYSDYDDDDYEKEGEGWWDVFMSVFGWNGTLADGSDSHTTPAPGSQPFVVNNNVPGTDTVTLATHCNNKHISSTTIIFSS